MDDRLLELSTLMAEIEYQRSANQRRAASAIRRSSKEFPVGMKFVVLSKAFRELDRITSLIETEGIPMEEEKVLTEKIVNLRRRITDIIGI